MKLTKTAIDALRHTGASTKTWVVLWDADLPCFGVRVWASGVKTFVLFFRFQGRKRYLTLGRYGHLTLPQARDLARLRLAEVIQGVDPAAERQKARRGETVADLARHYIAHHAKPHNKTWEKDQERLDRYVLPAFGALKCKALKRGDISRLHHKIGVEMEKPTTANRVLSLLASMLNRARREYGFLDEGAPNPADGIERFPERKRDRFVKKDEMPKLALAITGEENVYAQAAIWLYLFTGLRKEELLALRWEQVDLKACEIYIADTKAGRPHTLPISTPAALLLERIPRQAGNPFVLCGGRQGHHLVNITKPWMRIRKKAGLLDVRLHDLRRTVGSWMAQSGSSLPLIGHVLNHSNTSTTAVYARFHRDPVAEALERHGLEIATYSPGLFPAALARELPPALTAASSDVDENSRESI